jgi:hypothetical protein
VFVSSHSTISLSTFSRVLDAKEKTKPTTVRREAQLLELRNGLSRNLLELRESQRIHMPGLGPLLGDYENPNGLTKLWLPSDLSSDERVRWCLPGIPALEFRFRYAQADDSLADIRRFRRMLQGLRDQNFKHPSQAQKSITRTKGLFESFQARIRRVASRYRHSYQAMLALDPSQQLSPGWMLRFKKLEDADIRGPGRESDDLSEGKFQMSWIWLVPRLTDNVPSESDPTADAPKNTSVPATDALSSVPTTNPTASTTGPTATTTGPTAPTTGPTAPTTGPTALTTDPTALTTGPTAPIKNDPEVTESMRVHWARCQARADRYEEEVTLIVEEMGRTLRYFEWKQSWWLSLQSTREQSASPPTVEVCRGLRAYSSRQANLYRMLISSFATQWRKLLVSHNLGTEWIGQYSSATDSPCTEQSCSEGTDSGPGTALARDQQTQADSLSPSPSAFVSGDVEVDPPLEIDADSGDDGDDDVDDDDDDDDDDDYADIIEDDEEYNLSD